YLGIEKIENLPNFEELNKKLQDLEKTETQSETVGTEEKTEGQSQEVNRVIKKTAAVEKPAEETT
ncbi:MAG: hypothetical protein Q8L57_02710, partial [bacterium]|nr:hypothetical protein [bacterium]